MKRKLFKLALCAMALLPIGAWAEAITVGLTQDYSANTSTEEGTKTWSSPTAADDHLTLTQQIGTQILNYEHATTGKGAAYIDGTGHGTGLHCWRVGDPGTSYDNQYVGFDLTISSGYVLNISKINARALYISTGLTWKIQILSNTDAVLYESSEMTMVKTGTSPKIDLTVSTLSSADKAKLQEISGSVKVRLWAKGGKTKYFGIDQLTITGEVAEYGGNTYDITTSIAEGQESYGSIDPSGTTGVAEGQSLLITATANTGYGFINWTKDDVEVSTNASYTVSNVQSDAEYIAHFKSVYQVTWNSDYRGTYGKAGTNYNKTYNVNERWADINDKFTIPSYMHKYYYREGYHFSKWQIVGDESSNRYNSGDEITVTDGTISSNKVQLRPVFVPTTATLATSNTPTTVTWNFAKSNMVFADWQCGDADKYEYFTTTATVNGEVIDIPMKITKGKVANYTRTDDMAQTNQDTQFTIPAVKGMVVIIADAYTNISTTTIAGSTDYTGTGTKTISYTYTGEDSEISIVIGETGQYLKTIVVKYPASIKLNASGYATYSNDCDVEVSGAKAYTAELDLATPKITCHEITSNKIPAGNGVLLYGDAGATVTLSYTTGAEALSNNNLKATTDLEGNLASKTVGHEYYALSGNTFKTLTGDFVHHKAYFEVSTGVVQARSMRIVFGDEVTGISETQAEVKAAQDGKFFKDGKLFIMKNGVKFNAAGAQVK